MVTSTPLAGLPAPSQGSAQDDRPGIPPHLWAALRFRQAKQGEGWVLLGIPEEQYPLILRYLMAQQAQFLAKHISPARDPGSGHSPGAGKYLSLWFRIPPAGAAALALRVPAPAGTLPLVVSAGDDRLLWGKAALCPQGQRQAQAPDSPPSAN
jgi:hypothetical protein